MANGRVGKVEDVLSIGDIVKVEVIEVDNSGKINLDRVDKPDVAGSNKQHHDSGHNNHNGNGGRKPRRRNNDH